MNTINNDYIAGFLEISGGFYLQKGKNRKSEHPTFKLRVKQGSVKLEIVKDIFDFLLFEHDIYYTIFNERNWYCFQISQYKSIELFVAFINKHCNLKKKNQDEVERLIRYHHNKSNNGGK